MIPFPNLDPVAFHIGPLAVNWYGLMYLLAFASLWGVLTLRLRHSSFDRGITPEQLSDMIFYGAIGTIVGGRLGYMLFYGLSEWLANPLLVFQIWKGGMSFHGGMLGVILALWLYAKKHNKSLGDIADFVVPAIPLGLAFGRLGNFINGELWGRYTEVPWAMVFPNAGLLPRHPSQLYEFFLEGILLFIIVWLFSAKPRPRWAVSALFLMGYGLFRFFIEFFREPDRQLGFVAFDWMTQGQLLSLPMFIVGFIIMCFAYRGHPSCKPI